MAVKRDRGAVVEARLREAVSGMAPILGLDACAVSLEAFDAATGIAVLRVRGGCAHCEMTVSTFQEGIEAHLRMRVRELRGVRTIGDDERDV